MADYSQRLKKISDRPALEAELLLAFVLKKDRAWLLAHNDYLIKNHEPAYVPQGELRIANNLINKRLKGEPLAYLLGEQEFYGLPLKVNKNVLIPRPETEMIVDLICHDTSYQSFPRRRGSRQLPKSTKIRMPATAGMLEKNIIIDVGTGSGAIIISLAKTLKNKNNKFFAIDISASALKIAKQNAKLNGVSKKIKFIQGNLLEPLFKNLEIKNCFKILNFKLKIIANLPYLTPRQIKNERGIQFEPKTALDGGADGLKYYRLLAKQIQKIKKTYPQLKIELLAEIDPTQAKLMKKLFAYAKKFTIKKDFRNLSRLCVIEI